MLGTLLAGPGELQGKAVCILGKVCVLSGPPASLRRFKGLHQGHVRAGKRLGFRGVFTGLRGWPGGGQRSRGLTMVKPESLLLPLLSSSGLGLELGLPDEAEAEAGPVSGSENTGARRAELRRGRGA